eukprot:16442238-Heterocapsa_arctica.AAC.1
MFSCRLAGDLAQRAVNALSHSSELARELQCCWHLEHGRACRRQLQSPQEVVQSAACCGASCPVLHEVQAYGRTGSTRAPPCRRASRFLAATPRLASLQARLRAAVHAPGPRSRAVLASPCGSGSLGSGQHTGMRTARPAPAFPGATLPS